MTEAAVIGSAGHGEGLTAAEAAVLAAVEPDAKPQTVDLGKRGDYRVVATAVSDGEVLVTGLPLGSTQTALLRLMAVGVAAGVLGLLVAGIAAYVVIGRTLRPLHRVAATASRVAELPLSSGEVQLADRVPPADTDPHTEVGRVGTALNRLLDHVEFSMAARQASETRLRQFVADASHELRTPVTSIRGYTELVRRRGGVSEDVDQSLRRVEAEAVRMSGLVDDLLLLARLDAGRELSPGTVDLTALVMDVVSDAHAAGPAHRWRVDLPGVAVLVPGDGSRLHQVLANLLANVRTHTPEGTTATTGLRADDGWAVLEVTDDGPGIPGELQGEVFERFARGIRRGPARAAAPDWAWPSCTPSSPVTAAPWTWPARPAGPSSPCACRTPPSSNRTTTTSTSGTPLRWTRRSTRVGPPPTDAAVQRTHRPHPAAVADPAPG